MEAKQIKIKTVESNRSRKHVIIFSSDENSNKESLINTLRNLNSNLK